MDAGVYFWFMYLRELHSVDGWQAQEIKIERCHAFGTLQGVNWSPTSLGRDDERLAA